MKKFLIACLCALLATQFFACNKRENPDVTTTASDAAASDSTTSNHPLAPVYSIETITPDFGAAVQISYAVLKTGDAALDEILLTEAKNELSKYIPNASSISKEGGEAEYTVTAASVYTDERLLSAIFTGSYAVYAAGGSAEETNGEVFYTVNIDLAERELLGGGDIFSDFSAFITAFTDGKFEGGERDADYASLIAPYRPEYGIYPYVCFDNEYFYVNITETGVTETNTLYKIARTDAAVFLDADFR